MLFTQLFESDFNKKLNEVHDDYEDCSYCSGTGEGRWEGSTCTHCNGSGVEPESDSEEDFEDPDGDVADMDNNEESYYEKSLRSRGLGEDAKVDGQDTDVNVVVEKLQQIAAHAKQQIQNADYDQQKRYATIVRDRALAALDMITQGGNTPEAASAAFKYMQTGKQGVAEGSLEEVDRRGFLKGIGAAAAAGAAGYQLGKPEVDTSVYKNPKAVFLIGYLHAAKKYMPRDRDTLEINSIIDDYLAYTKGNALGLYSGSGEFFSDIGAYNRQHKIGRPDYTEVFDDDVEQKKWIQSQAKEALNQLRGLIQQPKESVKQGVAESRMAELDAEYEDYKRLSPREFYNMYKTTKQQWLAKYKSMLPQQGVAEADKKKDDEIEPEVKDVGLQRAITRAKADFPTAGSGLEALAKDFMRGQEQDQKSFDQIRQAERQQDQMLSQINKIDQEQAQEIQGLEKQNSGLASRLQQLQSVNSQLEKKLAAMSGKRAAKSAEKETNVSTPMTPAIGIKPTAPAEEPKAEPKSKDKPKAEPTTSRAIGQVAKTLAPPTPSAAIGQMAQQLQPRQKELDFDNNLVTLKPSKFNTSKAVDASYRDVSTKLAKAAMTNPELNVSQRNNMDALRNLAAQQEMPVENKEQKPERPEADYGDEYQSMVKRVGQKAKEGPRKTVWDPVKRVYKTVPVNK